MQVQMDTVSRCKVGLRCWSECRHAEAALASRRYLIVLRLYKTECTLVGVVHACRPGTQLSEAGGAPHGLGQPGQE